MSGLDSRDASSRRRLKLEVAHEPRTVAEASTKQVAPVAIVSCNAELEGRPLVKQSGFIPRKPRGPLTQAGVRELFALAWPIAAAMLGETAMGLVDTKLAGGLGPGALGGVGMATTLMFLGYAVVFGIMRGVKVRTAHAIGEGRPLDGFVYARSGVLMGAVLGVGMMVACRDVSGVLLTLGTDPAIVPYARDFLAAVTLGAPSTCALAALVQHRQAIGDSRTPMVIGITGNVFNALLAYALIYGHFGLPAFGVRGAGWATALTETLELTSMTVLLVRAERHAIAAAGRDFSTAREPPARLSFRGAVRGVAEIGVPTGLQFGAEMLAFTAFTLVLGSIGDREIAGHQIALNVIRVSFLPGVAVSEAASVMVGRALGKRSLAEADAAVKSALKIAVGFMATCGVAFALVGGLVAAFFSNDPAVVAVARRLLLVAAIFQVLDAVNIVYRGALRGAKDVRISALIGIGAIWVCLPPAAWLLGKQAGLGALGGWVGFVGETTVASLLLWRRWSRGAWRMNYTRSVK